LLLLPKASFSTSRLRAGQRELGLGRICERNKEWRADGQIDRDRIQRFREHQRKQLEIEAGEAVR
jgi:hypothetical protein